MSEHPMTPMTEADLRRHLGEQTDRDIGLLDLRSIDEKEGDELNADLDAVAQENEIVVFDGFDHDHQRKVGRLVWNRCTAADSQMFSASSSGLNYALTHHWHEAGIVEEPDSPESASEVDRIVVMSGSASPVNRDQIEWALDHGFAGVRLDTPALIDPDERQAVREETIKAALDVLEAGKSVVCYSALGPDDSAIKKTRDRGAELGFDGAEIAERLGTEQGRITRRLLEETGIDRACIAGGDTSGYVAPHLDVYALEFLSSVGPGSPLCRAHSHESSFDGIKLALKGGQVQTISDEPDYFGAVREGGAPD